MSEMDDERIDQRILAEMSSRYNVEKARELIQGGHVDHGLAFLARSLRRQSQNNPATQLAVSHLGEMQRCVLLEHKDPVSFAKFSSDGAHLVTASKSVAQIWNYAGEQVVSLQHRSAVNAACFNPDGSRLATAYEESVLVWHSRTGQQVLPVMNHESKVQFVEFSPDGLRILTAAGKRVMIWDAETGLPLFTPVEHEFTIRSASFSPISSDIIITACSDFGRDSTGYVQVWSTETSRPVFPPLRQRYYTVYSAGFSPNGALLVTSCASGDEDRSYAQIWDAITGLPINEPLFHSFWINSTHFSPDSSLLVTASFDTTAQVWDVSSGENLFAPLQLGSNVLSAKFHPDGCRILTTWASMDPVGYAQIWDSQLGLPLTCRLYHENGINSAYFSPCGSRFMTVAGKFTRLWESAPIGAYANVDELIDSVAPSWLPDLIEAIAFATVGESEIVSVLSAAESQKIRLERVQSLGDGPWERYGRWLLGV